MNSISVIGTGYVGLVSGACLAEFGWHVCCMDVDPAKIAKLAEGNIPFYEPGLQDVVTRNCQAGRLSFTTDMAEAVQRSNILFIAVGTPPLEDGSADLKYVLAATSDIARHMTEYKVIVNKSTVPVGTGRLSRQVVGEVLAERGAEIPFDIVSNPEFLREGSAVGDFMHPDRIVVGHESDRAREMMQQVYQVLYLNNHPFIFCNLETAELIKYASNAFLATKITFANEIANLCEAAGADVKLVTQGMGKDNRIGKYFLRAGAGYGGSCFPKDTQALAKIGKDYGVPLTLVEATISANHAQKLRMVGKILAGMGDVKGKTIALLGLAFKPETDDMREAPAIPIVRELLKQGASIRAYDPAAMRNAADYAFGDCEVFYATSEYEAVAGADALVLLTEWNQFRSLDLERILKTMSGNLFFDLRNVYEPEQVGRVGLQYFGVGRGAKDGGAWEKEN